LKQVYTMMHGQKNIYREWRYQMLQWYNLSSWWWAWYCSKHVEDYNV